MEVFVMKRLQTPSNTGATMIVVAAALLLATSLVYADEAPEVTMSVLESEDDAERVISEIQLPPTASPVAQERAAQGLETANEARERGREFGQERAEQARDQAKPGKLDKPGKPGKPDKPNKPGKPDN
jgi:hypothetical protein